MEFMPCLVRSTEDGGIPVIRLGHPLLDDYLAFVAARARANTWLAVAFDLKVFFGVVAKPPAGGRRPRTCSGSWRAERASRHGGRVVRLEDGEAGLAARTIARRLSSVRGLYASCAPGRTPACAATRCREAWLPGGGVRGVAGAGCR